MSQRLDTPEKRKEILKHMILQLHMGEAPDLVRKRLAETLKSIPYDEVMEVEQELIMEGLPEEEVLEFCDIHTMVLEGHIDQEGAQPIPPGHPVDTFKKENIELENLVDEIEILFAKVFKLKDNEVKDYLMKLLSQFNKLMDVDKHYKRKEYLVFPFLEKYGITGPPKVMWGKHDQERELIKASIEALRAEGTVAKEEAASIIDLVLRPAANGIMDMIMKEEEILLPMCMDKLTDEDWYQISQQTMEFGFCLYDPQVEWKPEGIEVSEVTYSNGKNIQLPTGSFAIGELAALFSLMPVDLTFVDQDDKVKFFSLGPDRIFPRNRAVLGRDVRLCHPPSSVHVVEKILADFKSGKESSAKFWINMHGRFIYIEYFALRGKEGEYLGTIEFTQDLTEFRKLEGEQRLLSYK
jgi:DUF438 domain-containing protein